ncbi:MAG: hypothetical protein MUD09_00640 [Desulfobacterales bacterium]|nr:hypothetical protein [Desulfobacterales bacterium]
MRTDTAVSWCHQVSAAGLLSPIHGPEHATLLGGQRNVAASVSRPAARMGRFHHGLKPPGFPEWRGG